MPAGFEQSVRVVVRKALIGPVDKIWRSAKDAMLAAGLIAILMTSFAAYALAFGGRVRLSERINQVINFLDDAEKQTGGRFVCVEKNNAELLDRSLLNFTWLCLWLPRIQTVATIMIVGCYFGLTLIFRSILDLDGNCGEKIFCHEPLIATIIENFSHESLALFLSLAPFAMLISISTFWLMKVRKIDWVCMLEFISRYRNRAYSPRLISLHANYAFFKRSKRKALAPLPFFLIVLAAIPYVPIHIYGELILPNLHNSQLLLYFLKSMSLTYACIVLAFTLNAFAYSLIAGKYLAAKRLLEQGSAN